MIRMPQISAQKLNTYRKNTFRWSTENRVRSKEEAIDFVNQRGFIFFWPIKDIQMPSLWVAVAGDRHVADAHDDPGHVTWGWKDSLLGARRWYYGKVLRKKATMISLDIVPYFYALSENYGSPEEDYLIQYMQGRLTQEAKAVYEALLTEGPLDTIALRRAAHLSSRESDSRFNRALTDLQADFKVLPVGVSQAGGWRYSFVYELVPRHYTDLLEKTRYVNDEEARQNLVRVYFQSVGAAQSRDVRMLFRWSPLEVSDTLTSLIEVKEINTGLTLEGQSGEWFAIPEVL
jgi:hypothetical protein